MAGKLNLDPQTIVDKEFDVDFDYLIECGRMVFEVL